MLELVINSSILQRKLAKVEMVHLENSLVEGERVADRTDCCARSGCTADGK